jgi:hypothetical protein
VMLGGTLPTANPAITSDRYYYVATLKGNDSIQLCEAPSYLTPINFTAGTTFTLKVMKVGYVDSLTISGTTVTAIIQGDTILRTVPTVDNTFKVSKDNVMDFLKFITIPGEQITDATNPQGMFYQQIPNASYLLPVDASVGTAATGSGAVAFNVYCSGVALFAAAPDLTTTTALNYQRPTDKFIKKSCTITTLITNSAGTVKASNFQLRLYYVPIYRFTKP